MTDDKKPTPPPVPSLSSQKPVTPRPNEESPASGVSTSSVPELPQFSATNFDQYGTDDSVIDNEVENISSLRPAVGYVDLENRDAAQPLYQATVEAVNSIRWFNVGKTKQEAVAVLEDLYTRSMFFQDAAEGRNYSQFRDRLIEEKARQDEVLAQELESGKDQIAEELRAARKAKDITLYKLDSTIFEKTTLLKELDTKISQELLSSVSLYEYNNPAEDSVELQRELKEVIASVKDMVRNRTAIRSVSGFTFNNSEKEGAKFVKDFSTLMLTAYNQEAENAIVKATGRSNNIDVALNRLDKAEEKIRKMGSLMDIHVDRKYHRLRKREIELAFMYKQRLAAEKDEERARREALKEEQKVIKEALEAERKLAEAEAELQRQVQARLDELEAVRVAALDKQGAHYENVIQQLDEDDPVVLELKEKLAQVGIAKEKNQSTLANTKAGYVYVISNIGSFGEGVVKIGLTRRQEPMDRVKELGDASVPFHFDVHALHFSDDAVSLETALHRKFADRSVNKVNMRKEFFRVTPAQVRDEMSKLSDGKLLTFTEKADAADYRASI
jgi:hypothetical protein